MGKNMSIGALISDTPKKPITELLKNNSLKINNI